MGLLDFQSPFSILGLRYSDNSPNAIKSAYKIAVLHCHCDKNPGPDIPAYYFNLVCEAYNQLCAGGLELNQFKGYPVIFYPRRDDSKNPIFRIPKSSEFTVCECGEILLEQSTLCNSQGCQQLNRKIFTICNACKTPIPEEGYNIHFSQHTDICHICNEVKDRDHNTIRHPEKLCPLCPALNEEDHHLSHALDGCFTCDDLKEGGSPTELMDHIHQDHFDCPLCGQECGDMFGDHFFEVHSFSLQRCCNVDVDVGHYRKEHNWLQCPYPKCELDIAKGELWDHMASSHGFKQCSDCSRSEERFIKDQTHIKAHAFEKCPKCSKVFYITNLPHHLVLKHNWLLCSYCDRAEGSEHELKGHIKEDHRLIVCPICQQEHLEEETDIHRLDLHGWLKCSWCNRAFVEEELRTHITVSHPPRELCDCGYEDTITGLRIHKIQSHAWRQCPYCENIEPPDRIERHTNSHQPMTCQECNISFLPEKQREHFLQTHQHVQCSFCDYSDIKSKMVTHMQSHLNQSQLQPHDIPVPQKKEDLVTSYSSIKCASCRERKKKVRTNNPNISIQY